MICMRMMKKPTQEQQVIDCLRENGGYATLRRLNELLDFSTWSTKTPEASVRRIVQLSDKIFRIQPGLWALTEAKEKVLRLFKLKEGDRHSEEVFSHGYYQGLLIEIGRYKNLKTYVPAQDKSRLYLGHPLSELSDTTELPQFTNPALLRKARTVDVIWFNERDMPCDFYEVEHTTDIKNSLSKFYELQDFSSGFYIVAESSREKEFNDKLNVSMFEPIKDRVQFLSYDRVVSVHANLKGIEKDGW
jgi:hypothetical protein